MNCLDADTSSSFFSCYSYHLWILSWYSEPIHHTIPILNNLIHLAQNKKSNLTKSHHSRVCLIVYQWTSLHFPRVFSHCRLVSILFSPLFTLWFCCWQCLYSTACSLHKKKCNSIIFLGFLLSPWKHISNLSDWKFMWLPSSLTSCCLLQLRSHHFCTDIRYHCPF